LGNGLMSAPVSPTITSAVASSVHWRVGALASHESAGKRRPRAMARSRCGAALSNRLGTAARTKKSYYSAPYARIARRRGANKAAVAVANSMLFTVRQLLQQRPAIRRSRRSSLRASSRSCRRGEPARTAGRGARFRRHPLQERCITSQQPDNYNPSLGPPPPCVRPKLVSGESGSTRPTGASEPALS